MKPTIAIFGGTFDPPHQGHIDIAQYAIDVLEVNCVYFLPCGQSIFKKNITAYKERLSLLENITRHQPKFLISHYEQHKKLPYSLHSLQYFRDQFPENKLFFLLGLDAYNTLPSWLGWENLTDVAHLAVFNRNTNNKKSSELITYETPLLSSESHIISTKEKSGSICYLNNKVNNCNSTNIRNNNII